MPDRLLVAGIVNYVYERDHALLTRLKVPADAKGVLPLRAEAQWLACTDKVCVPERGSFSLDLPVGTGAATERARFDEWRRALPRPLASPAKFALKRRQDRDRHPAAGERRRSANPISSRPMTGRSTMPRRRASAARATC